MEAEDAAHELPSLPLDDALQLVKLYAARESPKYEKALRGSSGTWTRAAKLQHFAAITASLARRAH